MKIMTHGLKCFERDDWMKGKILAAMLCGGMVLSMAACQDKAAPEVSSALTSSVVSGENASGNASESAASKEVLPGVNAGNFPRIDGSTANMPLIAEVYSQLCGVSLDKAETMVEVSTTAPAWRRLANGEADLLLVYEAPESVKEELGELESQFEVTPIGRDGLVFLVNAKNQVSGLTQEQLRDIYSGKITDWSGVGGEAGPIAAFQRDETSGSQTLFLKLLMKDLTPMTPPKELVPGFMGQLIDGVADYDGSGGAIGYSVYYYAKEMYQNPNLKLLTVDGVEPASETIGGGTYPLVNDFYVAIRKNAPKDSPQRLIRDWLVGDGGRAAMEKAGYVPMAK